MAPASAQVLLSPAELSYLRSSLSFSPPIRPDGRTPTQFRPLIAESDILPSTNGSARVCFADGTEAIVGVKAEVERSKLSLNPDEAEVHAMEIDDAGGDDEAGVDRSTNGKVENSWIEMAIEVPGYRDDDTLPIFLAAMLTEALLANGQLGQRLYINSRFHWKLYLDVLLLSPPLSYPLPLLSMTTHLALLSTRLPRLISEGDEDPMFDDDWEAAILLYPVELDSPPVTLLVATIASNLIFDPSKEELAVAESVLAISLQNSHITSIRSIDPPSRWTSPGIPKLDDTSPADEGVWIPPRGGLKRSLLASITKSVLEPGGVAQQITEALSAIK